MQRYNHKRTTATFFPASTQLCLLNAENISRSFLRTICSTKRCRCFVPACPEHYELLLSAVRASVPVIEQPAGYSLFCRAAPTAEYYSATTAAAVRLEHYLVYVLANTWYVVPFWTEL